MTKIPGADIGAATEAAKAVLRAQYLDVMRCGGQDEIVLPETESPFRWGDSRSLLSLQVLSLSGL